MDPEIVVLLAVVLLAGVLAPEFNTIVLREGPEILGTNPDTPVLVNAKNEKVPYSEDDTFMATR